MRTPLQSPQRHVSSGRNPTLAILLALLAVGCSGSDDSSTGPVAPTSGVAPPVPVGLVAESPVPRPGSEATSIDPDSAREPIDLVAHVPNNALAYFECSSLDALAEALLRYTTMSGTSFDGLSGAALATMPLVTAGIDPATIDRSAPIGFAFAPVPGELFPSAIVIVPALTEGPVASSAAALTARGMKARRIDSGYVIVEHVEMLGMVDRGEARVAQDLPEGFLRGRFGTETFVPLLAPSIYTIFEQINESYRLARPDIPASKVRQFSADDLLEELRRPEEIAFGVSLNGDRAGVSVRLIGAGSEGANATEPTSMAAALGELSHHIDFDDPTSLLVGFDREEVFTELERSWDALEFDNDDGEVVEGVRFDGVATRAMEDALVHMLESFAPAAAVSMQFEPAKAHLAIYLAANEAERAREAISLLLSKCELDEWGFEMALPIRSMLDGTLVEDYSVRFDTRRLDFDQRAKMREGFKTFLGDSSLHLKVATSKHHVLIVLGGDTPAVDARIRDFAANGLADIDIVRAIDAIDGAEEALIARADFVKLFGQVAGLGAVSRGRSVADTYREIQQEVGDAQAPFIFWTATSGPDEILGATFDVKGLSEAFEALKGSGL